MTKSKILTPSNLGALAIVAIAIMGLGYWWWGTGVFSRALEVETLHNSFPADVDTESSNWNVIPYGYTLAPWPKSFHGEPIVSKLTYHRGPPKKFIQEIIQIWRPVEVEVTLEGPKTLLPNRTVHDWKRCLTQRWGCRTERQALETHLNLPNPTGDLSLTWFETMDVLGARGVHIKQVFRSYLYHRFVIITDRGVFQTFTLKAVRTPIGEAAVDEYLKVIGGMKVRDELESARAWIQERIKSIQLDGVKKVLDPKLRIEKLIQVQNFVASHLSVDPTQFAPYFHLAGVTHLLGLELFRAPRSYFGNQESWTLNIKPMLETLVQYARDFGNQEPQVKNLEALLQDILLLQQKMSKGQTKSSTS